MVVTEGRSALKSASHLPNLSAEILLSTERRNQAEFVAAFLEKARAAGLTSKLLLRKKYRPHEAACNFVDIYVLRLGGGGGEGCGGESAVGSKNVTTAVGMGAPMVEENPKMVDVDMDQAPGPVPGAVGISSAYGSFSPYHVPATVAIVVGVLSLGALVVGGLLKRRL